MPGKLRTELGLASPDDFYQSLIGAYEGLSEAQSELLNAKLVLLLANHIGDNVILTEALAAARAGIEPYRDPNA